MNRLLLHCFVLLFLFVLTGCPSNDSSDSDFSGSIYYNDGSQAGGTLFRISAKDGNVEQLMNNAIQPDIMANGDILAIENHQGRIMITDLYGANRRTLVSWSVDPNNKDRNFLNSPRISFDQKYVAYDGYPYNQVTYVVDAQSGQLLLSVGNPDKLDQSYYSPSWAPDGSLIVQGAPSRNNGLYLIDKDFNSITRIDPNLTDVNSPSVSPDGNTIAFISSYELWTMSFDGSNPRQIKTDLTVPSAPTWSPDSRYIAVVSGLRIYMVDVKNSTITRLEDSRAAGSQQISWK
ncbi:MAG: PD40 domain-containing protein [Saprospiraceae bacterium]|nr:PD40 domain-containing protein [Candidatus Vicinibacter affinis]MBK9639948.1 PD40 domain-containing protein [Candidatus Vicinibacter affinis]